VRPAVQAVDEPRGQVDPGGDALAGDEVAVSDVAGVPHDGDLAAGGEGVLLDTPSAEDSPPPRRKQPDGHYCHYQGETRFLEACPFQA
jgi:hypothetical protein